MKKTCQTGVLLLVLGVAACTGLTRSEQAAMRTWILHPKTAAVSTPVSAPPTRIDLTVRAVPGLDNDRILTLTAEGELSHITAARWADNLPEMMASLVARSLQQTGHFDVVSSRVDAAREDCTLRLSAQSFYAVIGPGGRPTGVQLAMEGTYRCRADDYQAISLAASIPVHNPRMRDIVAAFQQGVDDMLSQLLDILENT